jgi:hypothetical protein
MKTLSLSLILVIAFSPIVALAQQASEVEQMKADLVGKSMGGREKGWMFQSPAQIKQLAITRKTEGAQQRQYAVTLTLQDPRVPGAYRAEADVTYARVDSRWEIQVVGLKSLVKIE